jgi:hypothetical protein
MMVRARHRALLWLVAAALAIGFGARSAPAANACCGQEVGCAESAQPCEWTVSARGCCKEPLSLTPSYADLKSAAKGAVLPTSLSIGTGGTPAAPAYPPRSPQPVHGTTVVLRL